MSSALAPSRKLKELAKAICPVIGSIITRQYKNNKLSNRQILHAVKAEVLICLCGSEKDALAKHPAGVRDQDECRSLASVSGGGN